MPGSGSLVLAARPTVDHGGEDSVRRDRKGRIQWVAHTARDCTEADLWASPKLPARGDVLKRYVFADAAYELTGTWTSATDLDTAIAVVRRAARKSTETETVWHVDVFYEGVDSPALIPPEVRYRGTYQRVQPVDAYGHVIANSAGDAFEDGITVDNTQREVIVTRCVELDHPDLPSSLLDLWDQYEYTTNALSFQLPTPTGPMTKGVDVAGVPTVVPVLAEPGTVRLKEIDLEDVERRANPAPADARYYARITSTHLDTTTFVNNEGRREKVQHRAVLVDQGYNEVRKITIQGVETPFYRRAPIFHLGRQVTSPHHLDGTGKALDTEGYFTAPWALAIATGTDGAPSVVNRFYRTTEGQTLPAPAPGLLEGTGGTTALLVSGPTAANGGPAGSLTFNGDGSFNFVPPSATKGYFSFTYKAANSTGDSGVATVTILVGGRPGVCVCERYPRKDWTPILFLLNDW